MVLLESRAPLSINTPPSHFYAGFSMKSLKKIGHHLLPGHESPRSQAAPPPPPPHISAAASDTEIHHVEPASPLPRTRSLRAASMSGEALMVAQQNARALSRSSSSAGSQIGGRPRLASSGRESDVSLVSARRNQMLPMPTSSSNEPTIVECVFVVEPPREAVCWITKDTKPPNPDFVTLSVPTWEHIPVEAQDSNAIDAALGKLMRTQEDITSSASTFVTVHNRSDDASMYICSVRIRCDISNPCALSVGMTQPASPRSLGTPAPVRLSYRYVVICSRLPYFQLFWQILDKIITIERCHLGELLLQSLPADGSLSPAQKQAVAMCELFNNGRPLRCWMTIPALRPSERAGALTQFKSKQLDHTFLFAPVPNTVSGTLTQLSTISMAGLLRSFSPGDLVTLVAAMLLELPLVVVGQHSGRVSAICIALMTLAQPMTYRSPCVPMLPPHLHEAIDAPTGGIYGLATPNEMSCSAYWPTISHGRTDTVVFALVDNSRAAVFAPKSFPSIPGHDMLRAAIAPSIRQVRDLSQQQDCEDLRAWHCPEAALSHCARVVQHVSCFNHWLVGKIRQNLAGGAYSEDFSASSQLTIAQLTNLFRPANATFMRTFQTTQMYADYAEKFATLPPVDPTEFGDFIYQPL